MKLIKDRINNYNLMQSFYDKTLNTINCHQIGKIIAFNSQKQTAEIQIQHINEYKGELFTPVILKDVPVFIYGTPTAYITMPNLIGSTCILITMDRNIDAFLQTGEMYQPTTTRMHDLTDCIALCTFKTQVDVINNYDNEAITLYNQKIDGEGNTVYANIKITDKVKIQNTKQDLSNLINQFVTACENITVNTQTGIINNKQTFTELKTKFEELLQ